MTKIHTYTLTILEHHLDFFGHVNNAAYFEILEEARWDMLTHNGCGVSQIKEFNSGPVVLEAHIKYKRELKLRQKILIETKVISHKGPISHLSQNIKNEEDIICCEADFTFGFFDLIARKLVQPTPLWLHAFGLE